MKKILLILLTLVMALALVACNNGGETTGTGSNATSSQPAGTDSKTDDTDAKTDDDDIVVSESATTEAPETEPPVLEVPAAGFCAVGEVDTANTRVAVLFANGLVKTMTYVGDAPVSGTVMYCETEGDNIAFAAFDYTGYSDWRIYDDAGGDFFYGNDGVTEFRHYFTDDCAGFIKFSDTSWCAFSGKYFIQIADGVGDYAGTTWPANILAYDAEGAGAINVIYVDANAEFASGVDPLRLFKADGTEIEAGDKNVVLDAAA